MRKLKRGNHATIQLFLLMNFNSMPIIQGLCFSSSSIIHYFICNFLYSLYILKQHGTYTTNTHTRIHTHI